MAAEDTEFYESYLGGEIYTKMAEIYFNDSQSSRNNAVLGIKGSVTSFGSAEMLATQNWRYFSHWALCVFRL